MAEVTANGVTLNAVRIERAAEATVAAAPVVFLHGLIMDNLSSWYYTIAPAVARRREVLCYDLRGHGRSERPDSGYRLDDAVADLVGVLDACGIDEPVVLAGNSFGGTVALAAAVLVPERVAGLVLVEAHPAFEGWADDMIEDLEDLVDGFDGPEVRAYLAAGAPRKLRRMIEQCQALVAGSTMPDDFRDSALTTPEVLAGLSCPSLLLYGESSDILDRALTLEACLPDTELRIVEGASHALLMEVPDVVEDHVLAWLDARAAGTAHDGSLVATGRTGAGS